MRLYVNERRRVLQFMCTSQTDGMLSGIVGIAVLRKTF